MSALVPPASANPPSAATRLVRVRAPGRLHLGFLDPSASLGRRFGSLGLVIEGFATELSVQAAAHNEVRADPALAQAAAVDADAAAALRADLDRVAAWLHRLHQASGLDAPLQLRLHQLLPAHAGLGSGTQLALAVGRAFARWHGLAVNTPQLARWLGRGLRSGVGIAGFDQGGLLLDGGPGADGSPAPLLSRIPFPADWRVLVALDPRLRGLSGSREKQAIANLPPLPRSAAADLCHQVLMQVLPGAAQADFAAFAAGLNRLQQVLGDHFAPAQQGSAYTSPAVGRLMTWLAQTGGAAVGQSSWGPTGFAVLPSAAQAEALMAQADAAGRLDPALQLRIVSGRNLGASMG